MGVLGTLLNSIKRKSSFTITSVFERSKVLIEKSVDISDIDESDKFKAVNDCREGIACSESAGDVPFWYFEEVAIYSRSAGNYENEIATCKMYIDLINKYVYKHKPSKGFIDNKLMCYANH